MVALVDLPSLVGQLKGDPTPIHPRNQSINVIFFACTSLLLCVDQRVPIQTPQFPAGGSIIDAMEQVPSRGD